MSDENGVLDSKVETKCEEFQNTFLSSSSPPPPLMPQQCHTTALEQQPSELYKKLEIIKEIRSKTMNLQRIKTKLVQEIQVVDSETKYLDSYKAELDFLFQERLAIVDELKQINADINELETTIKQTDDEKRRALDSALRLKTEYNPLKENIISLRESIGLDTLEDCENDQVINEFMIDEVPNGSNSHKVDKKTKSNELPQLSPKTKSFHRNRSPETNNLQTNSNNLEPLSSSSIMSNKNPPFSYSNDLKVDSQNLSEQIINNSALAITQQLQNSKLITHSINDSRPGFRQQPPPMKACLSCNQQIHRNAPICPLCKAKSRSRNPKKPKRKQDES